MVDRCICHDVPFQVILAWADTQNDCGLDSIEDEFGCGGSCGMCKPYLTRVLRDRITRVPLMLDVDTPTTEQNGD